MREKEEKDYSELELYKKIFNSTQDGILLVRIKDRKFLFGNTAMNKMLGYVPEEFNKLGVNDIHPKENLPYVIEQFEKLSQGKIQLAKNIPVQRKDKSIFYVDITTSNLSINKKPYMIGVFRDVTKRKKSEEELEESEEKYRNVSEKANDGIAIIQDGIIVYGNPALEKIYGDSLKNILNQHFLKFIAPEEKEKINQYYQKRFKGEKVPSKYEAIFLRKDKTKVYAELNAGIISYRGKPADLVILRDVTERKKIEDELKANEALIKSINHNLQSSMIYRAVRLNDGTRKFVYLSDSVKKFYDATPEQVKANANLIYGRVYKEDKKRLYIEEEKANKNLSPLKVEARINDPSGKIRWSSFTSFPTLLPGGITQWDGVETDITERKISEEKKYQTLVESIEQGLYTTENGKFVELNKGMTDIFGYSKEEILGKNSWDLAKPKIRMQTKEKFFAKLGKKDYSPELVECLRKDGTTIFAEISMSKPVEEKVSGMVTDVTEKIKMKEAEEKYKILYESSADAIMIIEPPSWKFTTGNLSSLKIFNLESKKEFATLGPWDLSPKYQPDGQLSSIKAKKMIMKALKEGSNYFEWTHKRYKGEDFPATVLLTRVTIGEKTFLQATVRDITERKRIEQKAKESEIVKTEFISAISHELRTPITPIKSQIQRMLSTELEKAEQKDSLEIVLRNTIRMDRLIQDLLEITRMKAERFEIFKKKTNLNELINDAIIDLSSFAREQDAEIIFKKEELPEINLNRDRILEVITNIIDNAIKYANGKISVSAKKGERNVLIEIKDNGKGIPEKDKGKMFTPFYRGEKSGVQKYEGTGLGLSISKGIVEAHNGKIWFESKQGKGTKFFILLPIK